MRRLDLENGPTCDTPAIADDRTRLEDRRRGDYISGFHVPGFNDSRRCRDGVVAVGNVRCDLLTCGFGPGWVVASDRTVMVVSRRAVAPQLTCE